MREPILYRVYRKLQTQIEDDQKKIDRFTTDFLKNPASTLVWADEMFLIASRHHWYCQLNSLLTRKDSIRDREMLKERKQQAQRNVLNMASNPERSTSTCSNMIKRAELVVFADMLDPIDGLLREIE